MPDKHPYFLPRVCKNDCALISYHILISLKWCSNKIFNTFINWNQFLLLFKLHINYFYRSQLQLQQSKQSIISHSTSSSAASSKQAINMKNTLHTSYSESTSSSNNIAPSMTNSSTNSDHTEATPTSESKSLQRQMIHQYLQQKIQYQQLQQRLLQEAQKKQGWFS